MFLNQITPSTTTTRQPVYSLDANLSLKFISVTDKACVGDTIKVEVQTLAGGRVTPQLRIMVTLADGTASIIPTDVTKSADAEGKASWSWKLTEPIVAGETKVFVSSTAGSHQSTGEVYITYLKGLMS